MEPVRKFLSKSLMSNLSCWSVKICEETLNKKWQMAAFAVIHVSANMKHKGTHDKATP